VEGWVAAEWRTSESGRTSFNETRLQFQIFDAHGFTV
jgi:hypothetical protein